jgi:hypothetical protein
MPSARELLEQADALMRKNRSRGDDDIPLLTDAVAIAAAPAPASAPILAAVAPHTDVPLLTDAVEEVVFDFEPLQEQPMPRRAIMEGDPSDWLVMDTIDPAMHSITGRAPDTLAVVPPMTLKAAGSAATPPPLGSQAPEQTLAPIEESPPSPLAATMPAMAETVPIEEPSPSPLAAIMPAMAETGPIEEPPPSPLAATMPAMAETGPIEEPPPSSPAATMHATTETGPTEEPPPNLPAATMHVTTESEPAAADPELWRALAEQISMQVLQRVDLFTDTGLKEQLAQRLKPIVERASAELVVAITQNVGRLLRTYVSEAIEREIAQWKRDQH